MEKISVRTSSRSELVDITAKVQALVARRRMREGVCVLFCPHTTAALTINENADPSVQQDIVQALAGILPREAGYRHAEGNSDAHIKASLLGPSLTVCVEGGTLALGTWQGIYLFEGDGPRSREVWVSCIAEDKR